MPIEIAEVSLQERDVAGNELLPCNYVKYIWTIGHSVGCGLRLLDAHPTRAAHRLAV